MTDMADFLSMGGYAWYVWPSFGCALLALGGVVVWSQREFNRVRRNTFRQASLPRARRSPMRAVQAGADGAAISGDVRHAPVANGGQST